MEKYIKNTNAVARKLRPALTKLINHKLKVVSEKWRKREEIIEKRKIEAMAKKYRKTRKERSLISEKKENYESDTRDEINPEQAKDKYLQQF